MASRFDLEPRIEALQAAGLVVESDYQGSPAKWLSTALDGVDLYIVNCKGTKTNDTLVLVRLSKLEELLETESACQLRTEPPSQRGNLMDIREPDKQVGNRSL